MKTGIGNLERIAEGEVIGSSPAADCAGMDPGILAVPEMHIEEPLSAETVLGIKRMAVNIRSNIIRTIPPGKVGHLGGSASIADVLAVLYLHWMRGLDPRDVSNPSRDRLVISKGHAVLAQYAALVEMGYIADTELFKQI